MDTRFHGRAVEHLIRCREMDCLTCAAIVLGNFSTTFPQSSSLVPQGAESAEIGKLDAADENEYDESTDFCAKLMASSLAPVRTPQLKSGVEMGKVNRVEEKGGADVLELATEIHALNDKLISELDEMATAAAEYIAVPHVRHRDHLLACIRRAKTAGSAETGGEPSAGVINVTPEEPAATGAATEDILHYFFGQASYATVRNEFVEVDPANLLAMIAEIWECRKQHTPQQQA